VRVLGLPRPCGSASESRETRNVRGEDVEPVKTALAARGIDDEVAASEINPLATAVVCSWARS